MTEEDILLGKLLIHTLRSDTRWFGKDKYPTITDFAKECGINKENLTMWCIGKKDSLISKLSSIIYFHLSPEYLSKDDFKFIQSVLKKLLPLTKERQRQVDILFFRLKQAFRENKPEEEKHNPPDDIPFSLKLEKAIDTVLRRANQIIYNFSVKKEEKSKKE